MGIEVLEVVKSEETRIPSTRGSTIFIGILGNGCPQADLCAVS